MKSNCDNERKVSGTHIFEAVVTCQRASNMACSLFSGRLTYAHSALARRCDTGIEVQRFIAIIRNKSLLYRQGILRKCSPYDQLNTIKEAFTTGLYRAENTIDAL